MARSQYSNALMLFPMPESGLRPEVFTCSSVDKTGLEEVWKGIEDYIAHVKSSGHFLRRRQAQLHYWMRETIHATLMSDFYNNIAVSESLDIYEKEVLSDHITPFVAAKKLLEGFFASKNAKKL